MEEHQEPLLKPKRGLFSRKRSRRKRSSSTIPWKPRRRRQSRLPEAGAASGRSRSLARRRPSTGRTTRAAAAGLWRAPFLRRWCLCAAMAAEQYGVTVPFWTGDRQIQGVGHAGLSADRIWYCAGRCRCTASGSCVKSAASAHCWCRWRCWRVGGGLRVVAACSGAGQSAALYALAAGLALCFAQWGISRESRGSYDSFRTGLAGRSPALIW